MFESYRHDECSKKNSSPDRPRSARHAESMTDDACFVYQTGGLLGTHHRTRFKTGLPGAGGIVADILLLKLFTSVGVASLEGATHMPSACVGSSDEVLHTSLILSPMPATGVHASSSPRSIAPRRCGKPCHCSRSTRQFPCQAPLRLHWCLGLV